MLSTDLFSPTVETGTLQTLTPLKVVNFGVPKVTPIPVNCVASALAFVALISVVVFFTLELLFCVMFCVVLFVLFVLIHH